MISRQAIYECSNGIMPFSVHSTVHPNIAFAGGDLFSKECLSNFDGLLAFVSGGFSPLHSLACFADMEGDIKYPHILYGGPGERNCKPTLYKQKGLIIKGLDELTSKGCRHIAFHGGSVADATYVEGARECIRAIVYWISRNPGKVDNITLVDLGDDYYLRFGRLLPWVDGSIRRYVGHGSEFESYFDTRFKNDVDKYYDICNGLADRKIKGSATADLNFDKFNFSIGVFYMNLIPQAIGKVTMDVNIMHDFLKCAGWPEISCGTGGLMHSDAVLRDSGLFPVEDHISSWKKTVLDELEFFKAYTRDVLAGDIWLPPCTESKRLIKASSSFAEQSINEIHRLVYDYIDCLYVGRQAPLNIVLGEELYSKK